MPTVANHSVKHITAKSTAAPNAAEKPTENLRYYYRHKQRINTTRIGTRTIGPKPHEDKEREAEIVQNEIDRIGLRGLTF